MLQKLRVKNVALISTAEIELSRGLNVLSGETGAGKSIVVDCIMLLFGARYDKSLLRFGQTDGYVEGVFTLNATAKSMLIDMGFECDVDETCINCENALKNDTSQNIQNIHKSNKVFEISNEIAIIRRRFNSEGKSDIRINGQPCTVGMLKRITATLIDIYGQHDFQQLGSLATQLAILDYFDRKNQESIKSELAENYSKFKEIKRKIEELGEGEEREKEIDFLKFQIDEIENSGTYAGEEDEILLARKRALNTERIVGVLSESAAATSTAELGRAAIMLSKIVDFDEDFLDFKTRLDSVIIELDDISDSLGQKLTEFSDEKCDLDALEARLAVLRALGRKYGDFEKMTAFYESAKERLYTLENCEKIFADLIAAKQKLVKKIFDDSVRLSQTRRTAAREFCALIEGELHQLGMENAEFSINFSSEPQLENCENRLTKNGFDEVEFYFSANIGQPQMPLLKIISGGEMSRFMLALKAVSGGIDGIPTLVFDEIDAGISGKVGQEVAKKLALIATGSQVLCVTHLPQIAAMSDNHLYVKKDTIGAETLASIVKLDERGTIDEVSRLSGGEGISGASTQAAAEIRGWCNLYKKSICE